MNINKYKYEDNINVHTHFYIYIYRHRCMYRHAFVDLFIFTFISAPMVICNRTFSVYLHFCLNHVPVPGNFIA